MVKYYGFSDCEEKIMDGTRYYPQYKSDYINFDTQSLTLQFSTSAYASTMPVPRQYYKSLCGTGAVPSRL